MKSTFLVMMLFFSFSAMSQQFTVSRSVNITLPEGSSIVTKDSAIAILKKKFSAYQYVSELVSPATDYTCYNINGNILELYYKPIDGTGTYLANQKKRYDGIGVDDGMNASVQYTSSITTNKLNIPVLLIYHTVGPVGTYDFVSYNPHNIGMLIGTLRYAVGDKSVTTMLNTILNTIHFNSR